MNATYRLMIKSIILHVFYLLYFLPFYIPLTDSYLLLVQDTLKPGDVIFNASVLRLGSERFYKINNHRVAAFVETLIQVDPKTGQISILRPLECNGIYYPNLFTVHIESTSNRLRDVEYYSLPLQILITGNNCNDYRREKIFEHRNELDSITDRNIFPLNNENPSIVEKINEVKQWISDTYASFPILMGEKWQMICLRKSQYVNSISAFLPKSISSNCNINFHYINDQRFKVEESQGDLVASEDFCIKEPHWKITILFTYSCRDIPVVNSEHRLNILYHHYEFNDTDIAKRVRRELRNQSPFFERHLYVASVLEECEAPVIVTTVKARDPESNPITYSMVSLLDSRTQGMFDIDAKKGTVTTKVQLDRELVDVHYFRITATDESFPRRSGTTMLQINVLDANDHAPVFEMKEYEASVRESVTVGTAVITLKATDQDVGKNAEVDYSIQSINGGGLTTEEENNHAFKIDSKAGVITTRTILDREKTEVYTLIVGANDLANPQSTRHSSTVSVVIHVLDDNDNYPQFSERTYSISLNEDISPVDNPIVAHIKATDADQGANAAIRYAIISGNTQSQFAIDSLTGDISLVKPLDYESLRTYRLVIRAQDGGSPSRSNTTQLLVNVKDVNDNIPRFYTSLFQESVLENVPIGYSIIKVQAYDADEGANAEIQYKLSTRDVVGSPTDDLPFTVDASSGWIYTIKELDREDQPKFIFQVIAKDQGIPPQSASTSVIITVQDINDNDPVFEPKIYESVIAEDDLPGTLVATVTATDSDEDNRLHYELINGNVRGRFAITSQNGHGIITVAQPLDYKQEKRYILTITAADSGGRTDTATVYVNITDANNFAPVFENAPYSTSIFEDVNIGTTVLVVSATDNDVGLNAQVTYILGDGMSLSDSVFRINPNTGAITTAKLLDRETTDSYLLVVTAKDGGNPSHSDTTDVEITITDVNDNYPIFKHPAYSGSVSEDVIIGTSVVQVAATDADIGLNGRIRYILSEKDQEDGSFVIDPTSGVIRTNKVLDRESVAFYELEAYAIDRGSPTLSSSVSVTIRIEDVNDSPPVFSLGDLDKIVLYIAENSPIGSTVGEIYANDPDEGVNAIVKYSIIGGEDSQSFSLITRPGYDKAELITMKELDYESPKKKYDLIVRAASDPLRSDAHVEVIITDINDNAPVLKDFQIIFNNYKDHFPTGPIGRIPAFDADVTDKLHYRILSGNNANLLALNESTGELQLSPQLNTNVPKVASLEVSVSDGINEIKAIMQLSIRLITEEILFNSITVRLNHMTKEVFLSPLLNYFIDGLAAIILCPKENIILFNIQDDIDSRTNILNISFSVRRPDNPKEEYYTPQYLQEKIYLNRNILAHLSTVQILPFDDNICVREPCLNFEECLTILKFGNASGFIKSNTVLFRPIYPVTTFTCQCPKGFTGSKEHYLCDNEVNLCYSSPCKNNGTCKIREGGYTCICPSNYTGKNCEIDIERETCSAHVCQEEIVCKNKKSTNDFACEDCNLDVESEHYTPSCRLKTRSFIHTSYLTFPSLKNRYRLHIQIKFATHTTDGLLLYNGRYNEKHDFIALEIINGDVQFSFSLGSTITKAVATIPGGVSDGEWHYVTVFYYNKTAIVSIDDCDTALALKHGKDLKGKWACAGYAEHHLESRCASLTETCHRFLDLTGPLQLGGLPWVSTNFQIKNHYFEGCISDLQIDYKLIDLNSFITDNGTIAGCPEKKKFCASRPCQNGGKCIERWSTFKCVCTEGFGGKDCSEKIRSPWHFFGDGMLSFNPLLRAIQLPWLNSLSIRTLQEDTFLMSVQLGQNNSAVVSLSKGFLVYTYNDQSVSLKSKYISDGEWHAIEITWLGTEIKLSIDYDEYSNSVPFTEKIQGMLVGKSQVGGVENTYGTYTGHNNLEGCIKDIRIGNQQTTLTRPTVKENVEDGCFTVNECQIDCPVFSECVVNWRRSQCKCNIGYVGPLCVPVCSVNPCANGGTCRETKMNSKGYQCECNSTEYSGEYCEIQQKQPCPASWWGYPVCGPCQCNVEAGYNPDCHKRTGKCHCRENHYQPKDSFQCIPCDCYHIGSLSTQCNHETGQCKCKDGVIGLKCDSCPNSYAEVTLNGCEVVYDGCPRSSMDGIWWPRTDFGYEAFENCPKGANGKASRRCDNDLGGWQEPDLFNCTSVTFLELRKQLSNLENGSLSLNTFVAIKLAHDLFRATNVTTRFYGADILITYSLIKELLTYEFEMRGLNLTHSQDKDYIFNLIHACSNILAENYYPHWKRIKKLLGQDAEDLIQFMKNYLHTLIHSQHDTYTNPFEIVSENVVMGLDLITLDSLYRTKPDIQTTNMQNSYITDNVLTDTGSPFQIDHAHQNVESMITIPKYNNYILDKSKFDQHTKVQIPVNLLGIQVNDLELKTILHNYAAIVSYIQYKEAGFLLPENYDDSVVRRWGIDVTIGSPLISFDILIPNIEEPTKRDMFGNIKLHNTKNDEWGNNSHQHAPAKYIKKIKRDTNFTSKMLYKSLSNSILPTPIKVTMWLNKNYTIFNERSNPQCVHWYTARGFGEWSRVGCRTEINNDWLEKIDEETITINCTCNHLSTFAVLVDVIDLEFVPEPSLLEHITTYSSFSISLPILFGAYLILSLIHGLATNSNTIRKNLVLCVFLGECLYFIALKMRKPMIETEYICKLVAIGLHYFWLSAFSWMLVDAIHLYRMLTEMRDINHGPMRFYYAIGYVAPALVVILTVGVRAHQYGNFYFCWMSLYESVIWSLVGPICLLVVINIFILIFSIKAAFTLQDHVLGFGNLRNLLWVSVITLPLLGVTWILMLLAATERHPLIPPALSLTIIIHALFCFVGYCFANNRVRQNLIRTFMKCMGKKGPLLETASIVGVPSTSSQNITIQSRSALVYNSSVDTTRRNIGISTSSTTSRSTAKTSSSPYRSDTHLRHTSTSTSDVPSYMRGFEMDPPCVKSNRFESSGGHGHHNGGESDSDSERSEGQSLDLASSHSSDDDDLSSVNRKQRRKDLHAAKQGYLPNIMEHVSRCGSPPALNIVTNSQLFPAAQPNYSPRWSSELPECYLSNSNVPEVIRWSAETHSDNEMCLRINSPHPLPYPDVTTEANVPVYQSEHYVTSANYDKYMSNVDFKRTYLPNENMNTYLDQGNVRDDFSDDKYLFPYTAEEDHLPPHVNQFPAVQNKIPQQIVINDVNNPGDQHTHINSESHISNSHAGNVSCSSDPIDTHVSSEIGNPPESQQW